MHYLTILYESLSSSSLFRDVTWYDNSRAPIRYLPLGVADHWVFIITVCLWHSMLTVLLIMRFVLIYLLNVNKEMRTEKYVHPIPTSEVRKLLFISIKFIRRILKKIIVATRKYYKCLRNNRFGWQNILTFFLIKRPLNFP